MSSISERLVLVQDRIAEAAVEADRSPSSVQLIAVGKTFPAEIVASAVVAGATDLGENRVQEAVVKRPQVPDARWHLIGPLQRNKAKAALEVFDVVHTVDGFKIADRLQFLLGKHWPDRTLDVLLEVNVGVESQKAGVLPNEAEELLEHVRGCPQLQVRGLMAIPPWQDDPEASRPSFRALRELRDRLQEVSGLELPELSMGMSHDFHIAIAEGATYVRVGTAIFGARG
ncbi:MAG: YggS family pyridoxal phosphate-dependent enzyme [Holophagae bacterium]|jgi:pyridoxal phosphate enzyme (YggS family)